MTRRWVCIPLFLLLILLPACTGQPADTPVSTPDAVQSITVWMSRTWNNPQQTSFRYTDDEITAQIMDVISKTQPDPGAPVIDPSSVEFISVGVYSGDGSGQEYRVIERDGQYYILTSMEDVFSLLGTVDADDYEILNLGSIGHLDDSHNASVVSGDVTLYLLGNMLWTHLYDEKTGQCLYGDGRYQQVEDIAGEVETLTLAEDLAVMFSGDCYAYAVALHGEDGTRLQEMDALDYQNFQHLAAGTYYVQVITYWRENYVAAAGQYNESAYEYYFRLKVE